MCLAVVACWYIIMCRKCRLSRHTNCVLTGFSYNTTCSLDILCRNSKTTTLFSQLASRAGPENPHIRRSACRLGEWARFSVEAVYKHSSLCVVSQPVFTHTRTSGHPPVTLCLASDMSTGQINPEIFTLPPSEVIRNGSSGEPPLCRML